MTAAHTAEPRDREGSVIGLHGSRVQEKARDCLGALPHYAYFDSFVRVGRHSLSDK